jgi:hypothetical protein
MAISRTSAHFEQIVNDIVCVNCLIEVYLSFKIFYKDNNKYSKKQENHKKKFYLLIFDLNGLIGCREYLLVTKHKTKHKLKL